MAQTASESRHGTSAAVAADELSAELETYRRELTGYCYRLLGGAFDADDAVQETLLRAWRSYERFEGRSSLRTWLYRIATNVCFDQLGSSRAKRERPMGLGAAADPVEESLANVLPESAWVEPVPTDHVLPGASDPADTAVARESVRLAFVAALQHLPAKQRAVLILREVLRWPATEVAALLDTSVASVNSALQRARATLADKAPDRTGASGAPAPSTADEADLLERYVAAFERYDMAALANLLREDAVMNMPPYAMWLEGIDNIQQWLQGPGKECEGSRCMPVHVNGTPGFAQYRKDPRGGHYPWGIVVLENDGTHVTGITTFLDTEKWFSRFGLPDHLD
ncbi:sigma-70 family RNA polymerase sigma factor [Promicromonospora citrea]|uniref:DNA-directed RNA polymerase sigma-70 factor n=1 Tax=Promicromonospora citrea TaxID=43677 RepID=A0A8H9GCX5_9MICO|nr:sigma-70 family RNA polymerase sigma factor [Promicromonospora citrea]NNH53683.1 sigma-70 family RNA polymerase sigma factor [Promicromonospora citrea]GGM10594.1 DNA-directed RNA polymerase sigma-70 factor [Promicromonospora citrea]